MVSQAFGLGQLDKILWAVDPFAEQATLQRSAAWAIQEITRGDPAVTVQPAYLINNWTAEALPHRHVRLYNEKIEAFGNDSLRRLIRRIPLRSVRTLEVLARPFESTEEGARELVATAAHRGYGLIVASTRARSGGHGPSLLPGSFVEALADVSNLPLLVVNPRWRRTRGIPSILFATDFSRLSHDWFLRVLEFTRSLGAPMTLYHKIDFPLSQPYEVAVRIFPEVREVLAKKLRASEAEAARWAKQAKQAGVNLSVTIDGKVSERLADGVLEAIRRRPGMIVLAPPISRRYPYTTVRKLMRLSPYPLVLVPEPGKALRVSRAPRAAA